MTQQVAVPSAITLKDHVGRFFRLNAAYDADGNNVRKPAVRPASEASLYDTITTQATKITTGYTGADIASACNEAAIIAARAQPYRDTLLLEDLKE